MSINHGTHNWKYGLSPICIWRSVKPVYSQHVSDSLCPSSEIKIKECQIVIEKWGITRPIWNITVWRNKDSVLVTSSTVLHIIYNTCVKEEPINKWHYLEDKCIYCISVVSCHHSLWLCWPWMMIWMSYSRWSRMGICQEAPHRSKHAA